MPKSTPPIAALITRFIVIVIAVGLALAFRLDGASQLLHVDGSPAWISLLAPFFFLLALWAASSALARIHRGDAFGPAAVRGLNEMGYSLMLGAFAAIVAQPSLIYLFANGFQEMRGVSFNLSVENVTLASVGIVLVLLAREGQKLQAKLDEFV
jgi:hypothetical protein